MAQHRLAAENYCIAGTVWHVTMVADFRKPVLTETQVAGSVIDAIRFKCEQTGSYPLVWVVMPDHVHLMVELCDADLV